MKTSEVRLDAPKAHPEGARVASQYTRECYAIHIDRSLKSEDVQNAEFRVGTEKKWRKLRSGDVYLLLKGANTETRTRTF